MSKREKNFKLIALCFGLAIGMAGAGRANAEQNGQSLLKGKITYIRSEAPSVKVPPYRGERYEDMVPDTLDIAERARLAIQGIVNTTEPDLDYEHIFLSVLYRNPPVLVHSFSDTYTAGWVREALPLLRLMTGSDFAIGVDAVWAEACLRSIGPDGFFYISTAARPWTQGPDMEAWGRSVCWADGARTPSKGKSIDHYTFPSVIGRNMAAMSLYYLRDRNPVWKEIVEGEVNRLAKLVIDKGNYAYIPWAIFAPNAKVSPDSPPPAGLAAEEAGGGRLVQTLVQACRATGYKPALVLAGKMVNAFRFHGEFYDDQGRFIDPMPKKSGGQSETYETMGGDLVDSGGHFHAHSTGLQSMLEYATAAGDRELMEFVNKSYQWAKANAHGSQLVGWFPEAAKPAWKTCETCCTSDMIALAMALSAAGLGDYWDDADRWIRNQFAEQQMTRVDWIGRVSESLQKTPVESNMRAERVPERVLGAFTGYTFGNDYGITEGPPNLPTGTAGCCIGNAARTLYYIWESILDDEGGRLRVNLLLNRASKRADVYSHIPYEGRVDVKIKQPCKNVLVRVPEWIKPNSGEVSGKINGASHDLKWEGRHVNAGAGKPGDVITITFPISERVVAKEKIGVGEFTYIIKGNTVVSVSPPGKFYPLFYQRDQYRENQTRWVKRERFVPDATIKW